MDLGHCPKCGVEWEGGDRCTACGFVPIGAGLDKLPKKKKRKAKKYVEPGSWTGTLVFLFIAITGGGLYMYQPWREDWAVVRMLLGQGRPRSVLGSWEITKTVNMNPGQPVLVAKRTDRGGLKFENGGAMSMRLGTKQDQDRLQVKGKYEITGRKLLVSNLEPEGSNAYQFPDKVPVNLTWMGPDNFIANVNQKEMIYARRKAKSGSYIEMLRMGFRKKGKSAFGSQVTTLEQLESN